MRNKEYGPGTASAMEVTHRSYGDTKVGSSTMRKVSTQAINDDIECVYSANKNITASPTSGHGGGGNYYISEDQ